MALRLATVDDHPAIHAVLQTLGRLDIASSPSPGLPTEDLAGWHVIAQAQTVAEAMILIWEDWDLLVLDIGLPDGSGLDVLRAVRAGGDVRPVLVYSGQTESSHVVHAYRLGAQGFLPKTAPMDEVRAAILRVAGGARYVSRSFSEQLLDNLKPTGGGSVTVVADKHELLSDREFQVLCQIGYCKTLREIAAMLGCQPTTISAFRTRILTKLQLKNTQQLVKYVIEHHLIAV